jgi:hypothetical protein
LRLARSFAFLISTALFSSVRRIPVHAIEVSHLHRVRLIASSALVFGGAGLGRGRFEDNGGDRCSSCGAGYHRPEEAAPAYNCCDPGLHIVSIANFGA